MHQRKSKKKVGNLKNLIPSSVGFDRDILKQSRGYSAIWRDNTIINVGGYPAVMWRFFSNVKGYISNLKECRGCAVLRMSLHLTARPPH